MRGPPRNHAQHPSNNRRTSGHRRILSALLVSSYANQPDTESSLSTGWSYSPPNRPAVPTVQATDWVTNEIDAFILRDIEQAGLAPTKPADKHTLIKRATYDLTGLPPTIEQVRAFVSTTNRPRHTNDSSTACSPADQYGVKWGRHWLDLVRWAETDSYERDRVKPGAWRYRDWVDRRDQQTTCPTTSSSPCNSPATSCQTPASPSTFATGYLHLGIRDDEPTDPIQAVFDDLDGMLDTTSRVMLGASMGCARCHDHKRDPISTREYYSMLAFFEGLRPYKVGGGNGIANCQLRPKPPRRSRHR